MHHPCRLIAAIIAASLPAPAQVPAFPGAEGFGAHASGGRGGDVYTVTNLDGGGPGSLAEGIATAPAGGRTIVFAVSGYIHVPGSNLRIVQDRITIAGQTAPGDGIGLRDGTLRITGSDTVIRHLRVRHGKNGSGGDCVNVDSTADDSILDHVSMQFSTDENISFFNSTLDRFTMQNSLSAWGLESHNAGGLWDLDHGSCHHSLWAHHHTRNPKARPYGLLEWINNLTYDWGIGFIMGDSQTPAPWRANVIGSYFLSPPGRTDNIALEKATVDRNGNPNFSLHLDDCLHDSDGDGQLNGSDKGYAIVAGSEYSAGDPAGANRYVRSAIPFAGSSGNAAITIDDPLTAFKKVISDAGALRLDAGYTGPLRDEVDSLLFRNVVDQQTSRISRESDLAAPPFNISNAGFGTLDSGTPPSDIDLDGMPDFWERALGWNPAAADHNQVFANNGAVITEATFFPPNSPAAYTRLEEYLHFLSVPHATIAKHTAGQPSSLTTDLRKFTGGFSNSPAFTLSAVSGGTVRQFAADGTTPSATGPVVRFSPTLNLYGRAGFTFQVTDAEGSSWTRPFAILISATGIPRDLVWTGGLAGNAWDELSVNWRTDAGSPATFGDGDTALFDDRGNASPAIGISGTRLPAGMTVTGTKNYSFSGPGSLSSPGSLTKAGGTKLALSAVFHFTDGSFLNGGETTLENGGNLQGGTIRFTGGGTLTSDHGSNTGDTLSLLPDIGVNAGAVGNLNLSQRVNVKGSLSGGGTFNIFSPSTLGTEGRVYLDGASAGCTGTVNLSGGATVPGNGGRIAFRANGGSFNGFDNARVKLSGIDLFTTNNSGGNSYAIGELAGDANSRLRAAYNAGAGQTIWSVGGLNTDSRFDGQVMDGLTSITHFDKVGGGTLTLSGNHTHSGNTTVFGGTLDLPGSLHNAAVFVDPGGTLTGTGNLGGALLVRGGGMLGGTLAVAGQTTLETGATTAPGSSAENRGALTTAGGVRIDGNLLVFDLSASPAGTYDQILVTGGSGVLAGANTFRIHPAEGLLGSGIYWLVDCAPGIPIVREGAMTMNLEVLVPPVTRQAFSIHRSASGSAGGDVWLQVAGDASSLGWRGGAGSAWDLNTTANFSGGNTFYNLDSVSFDDSAATGAVTLAGSLEPHAVTVTNSTLAFTFGGAGSLDGTGSLAKSGPGILTISNSGTNSFSGGTTLQEGTLNLAGTDSPLGTGEITLAGGTLQLPHAPIFLANPIVVTGDCEIASFYPGNSTLVDSYTATFSSSGTPTVGLSGVNGILSIKGSMSGFSGTLDFATGSGMLRLNSGTSAAADVNSGSADAHFDLGDAGATLTNRNGGRTIHLGALSGGPATHLNGRQSGSGNTATTYVIGARSLDTVFDGTIHHGGDLSGLHLVKTGHGVFTLGGSSDFSGSLTVERGTLSLPGSMTCSATATLDPGAHLDLAGGSLAAEAVQIAAGALLTGPGIINSELLNDGTISASHGVLSIVGGLVNNGIFRIKSGGSLAHSGRFINNGVLDLLTSSGPLPADLENNGIIIDPGDLQLIDFTIGPTDVTLILLTHEDHSYQLEWSPGLDPGSWTRVGAPVAGDGTTQPFTHPGGANASRGFYRIAVDD